MPAPAEITKMHLQHALCKKRHPLFARQCRIRFVCLAHVIKASFNFLVVSEVEVPAACSWRRVLLST